MSEGLTITAQENIDDAEARFISLAGFLIGSTPTPLSPSSSACPIAEPDAVSLHPLPALSCRHHVPYFNDYNAMGAAASDKVRNRDLLWENRIQIMRWRGSSVQRRRATPSAELSQAFSPGTR